MKNLKKLISWIFTAAFSASIIVVFFCFIIKAVTWSLRGFEPLLVNGTMAALAAWLAYLTRDSLK